MRIDDLDHLPETTTIDASSIGIVQVSAEGGGRCRRWGAPPVSTPQLFPVSLLEGVLSFCDFPVLPFHDS